MIKLRSAAPLIAGALLVIAVVSLADAKREIQAVYNKLTTAMKKGDIKGMMSVTTPDFTMKEHGQVSNAAQVQQQMQAMIAGGMKMKKVVMKVQSVSVNGDTDTATSNDIMDSMMKMPDGKMHRMQSEGKSKGILVKTPQGWKFKYAEMISSKDLMDGKPFDPTK